MICLLDQEFDAVHGNQPHSGATALAAVEKLDARELKRLLDAAESFEMGLQTPILAFESLDGFHGDSGLFGESGLLHAQECSRGPKLLSRHHRPVIHCHLEGSFDTRGAFFYTYLVRSYTWSVY